MAVDGEHGVAIGPVRAPGRPIVKWLALWSPLRWPHGWPTNPLHNPRETGTRPSQFMKDPTRIVTPAPGQEIRFCTTVDGLSLAYSAVGSDPFIIRVLGLGISEGGWTAATYATQHTERITHLILYGAYCRGARARPGLRRGGRPGARDTDAHQQSCHSRDDGRDLYRGSGSRRS